MKTKPESKPARYHEFNDMEYKPDMELHDRYVNFSSEILRLSLLGVTAISTMIFLCMKDAKSGFHLQTDQKGWLLASVTLFSLSAGASLFHRFYATDSMAFHIEYLRKRTEKKRLERNKTLSYSGISLVVAEFLFGIAVVVFAVSIYVILFSEQPA